MLRYPFFKAFLSYIATDAINVPKCLPFLISYSLLSVLGFLLCCTVIEVYAIWVRSFVLRYPFFKALLRHITTDAVFQSIYHS